MPKGALKRRRESAGGPQAGLNSSDQVTWQLSSSAISTLFVTITDG